MKKQMTGKKLRLHAQTIQTLSTEQLGHAAGGANTEVLTDVKPNCGTFNCPTTPQEP
jgi:hypothetical protein